MAAMTTSPPTRAGQLLQRRCQDLVAAEMARLSRRAPSLQAEHLGEAEAALCRVMERLVLSRAHTVSAGQLAALFGLLDAA